MLYREPRTENRELLRGKFLFRELSADSVPMSRAFEARLA